MIPCCMNCSKAAYDEIQMKSYSCFAEYKYDKKLWYDRYLKTFLKDYDNKKYLKILNERNE